MYLSIRALDHGRRPGYATCAPWRYLAAGGFSTMGNVTAYEMKLLSPNAPGDD